MPTGEFIAVYGIELGLIWIFMVAAMFAQIFFGSDRRSTTMIFATALLVNGAMLWLWTVRWIGTWLFCAWGEFPYSW